MPASRSAATASGRTEVGSDPAEETRTPSGARCRPIASPSWLRAELATHRRARGWGRLSGARGLHSSRRPSGRGPRPRGALRNPWQRVGERARRPGGRPATYTPRGRSRGPPRVTSAAVASRLIDTYVPGHASQNSTRVGHRHASGPARLHPARSHRASGADLRRHLRAGRSGGIPRSVGTPLARRGVARVHRARPRPLRALRRRSRVGGSEKGRAPFAFSRGYRTAGGSRSRNGSSTAASRSGGSTTGPTDHGRRSGRAAAKHRPCRAWGRWRGRRMARASPGWARSRADRSSGRWTPTALAPSRWRRAAA